jgi:hypothetical protein
MRGGFTELMLFIQRLRQEGDEAMRIVAELDGRAVTLLHPTCMFADVVRRHDHTPAGAPREAVTFGLISPEDVAAVRELANANRVVLRFVGKLASQEWEVPPEQLSRMRERIKSYERLTGKAWNELPMEERACR